MRQGRGAKSPPLLPDAEGLVPTAFLSAPGRGAFPSAIRPNTIGGRRASVCPMFGKTYRALAGALQIIHHQQRDYVSFSPPPVSAGGTFLRKKRPGEDGGHSQVQKVNYGRRYGATEARSRSPGLFAIPRNCYIKHNCIAFSASLCVVI